MPSLRRSVRGRFEPVGNQHVGRFVPCERKASGKTRFQSFCSLPQGRWLTLSVALVNDDGTNRLASVVHTNRYAGAVEGGEHPHESIQGEPAEIGVSNAGEVGGSESGQPIRLAHRELSFVQRRDDVGGKDSLCLLEVGVRIFKISKDVPLPRTSSNSASSLIGPAPFAVVRDDVV